MERSPAPAHQPSLDIVAGVPDDVDALAAMDAPARAFLRASWFGGADRTFVVRGSDGAPLLALPTALIGPDSVGARTVPGSYWPFRSVPVAPEAPARDLKPLFAARELGPVWRMGPFYADDPAGTRLMDAARSAGWSALARQVGTTFVLPLAALRASGTWPRASVRKRNRAYAHQLAELGAVTFERVEGTSWCERVFDDLAAVERESWIAERTDGSGAKFMHEGSRVFWTRAAQDPALAAMMSAVIMRVGERPVAFSFDLNCGATQYGIAGSFDRAFARYGVGKIVTYEALEQAAARGIERVDLGAGDGGYKAAMGAVPGSDIIDCLFVRNHALALLLRPKWERWHLDLFGGGPEEAGHIPISRAEKLLIASLTTAGVFAAIAE